MKRAALLITFVILSNITIAQWVQTNGPYGGNIQCFAVSGANLFAATEYDGIFLSTNNGTSWTEVNSGLTSTLVLALAVSGANLFAGTSYSGVFLSTNNGTSWTEVNSGLTNPYISALAVSGTNLFAGTEGGGVFLSTNNGTSWTEVNSGLTDTTSVYALAVSGANLFAGTFGGGVFLSTNNGTSWTEVNSGLTNTDVRAFAVSGANLFAGTLGSGVWRRPLSEITLVEDVSNGLPTHFRLEQNYPNPFNPSTTISFSIPERSFVTLKIYDMVGREIAELVNEELETGSFEKTFDAGSLASGVYIYKITAMKEGKILFNESKQMLMIK